MKVPEYFHVNRNIISGTHNLEHVFSGLEKVPVLKKVFKNKLGRVLEKTKVKIIASKFYLWVDKNSGNIFVARRYLRRGKLWTIYLDIIHELVHIKQFHEGKNLYDTRFDYVHMKTEIEAYYITVKEAKRIGICKKQIRSYLKVPWITRTECEKLFEEVC